MELIEFALPHILPHDCHLSDELYQAVALSAVFVRVTERLHRNRCTAGPLTFLTWKLLVPKDTLLLIVHGVC